MKLSVLKIFSNIKNTNTKQYLLLVAAGITTLLSAAQSGSGGGSGSGNGNSGAAPELVFINPVLKSGTANQQGAVYRYSNVTTGVDAEVTLKKFSRNDIKMNTVDNAVLGWGKAFQPEFGLAGVVPANQNWYIDFELRFFKAGTNQKQKMQKVDLTALDVDGDGVSISEFCIMNNPTSVTYSTVSYLLGNVGTVGGIGQTFICDQCNLPSVLMACNQCGGDGIENNGDQCDKCDGSGKVYALCQHAYHVPATVQGPIENFLNIDTLATQVMATYSYVNVDKITFRYGAKSGNTAVNGSGIRLNSMWYRQFSLAPSNTLPVKLLSFAAFYNKKDVTLSWTGSEENFSHYVLQRSTDGKNFSDVAIIFANSSGTSNYTYKDANVSSSTSNVFYRLEMIDKAQEVGKYSDIRVVKLGKETESLQLTTYPNPVTDQVKITLPASWQNKAVNVELYTGNGILIKSMKYGNASQTETVQLGQISKGFYLVKATCGDEMAQQRIVKN